MFISDRVHTNERPYKCSYCQSTFRQRHGLIGHIRLHTGEKPFICEFCNKKFGTKCNLRGKQYIFLLNNNKRFGAILFDKHIQFIFEYIQVSHYFYSVPETLFTIFIMLCFCLLFEGEKPYKCDKCDKGYASKSGWNAHQS